MRRLVLAVTLAGCSLPVEKQIEAIDAPGAPFACQHDPPPTSADPSVTVWGTTSDPFSGVPLSGVQLQGFFQGIPGAEFTTTSNATGQYTVHQATGGEPRTFSVQASFPDHLVTTVYPPAALTASVEIDPQLVKSDDLMHLGAIAGMQLDLDDDQILLQVVDCNGYPAGGATVTTDPPGTVVYFVDQTPSQTAVMTDSVGAVVFIGNIPASNTRIFATANGSSFATIDVDPAPGGLIQAAIEP
ncbi:MAG TPA: hypothetical protein VLX92_29865 [Kofleriaceae bacterium]|nr:hypothetical protein [Kofleriaceae bacterium]